MVPSYSSPTKTLLRAALNRQMVDSLLLIWEDSRLVLHGSPSKTDIQLTTVVTDMTSHLTDFITFPLITFKFPAGISMSLLVLAALVALDTLK